MTMASQRISILGGGLMGHGIALVFAAAGHAVKITDPSAEVRDRVRERIGATLDDLGIVNAALERIDVVATLEDCVAGAQWVIEAAPEDLALKQRIFADVERSAPAEAILASNTSVIPIGQIMTNVARKQRTLGTHWWNPPYLVPLVEVVRTAETADATVAATIGLLKSVGKAPVEVKKDVPASSATGCSTRCGGRRSRWSRKASATPRRWTTSSNQASARGSPCWARWRMPTWSALN